MTPNPALMELYGTDGYYLTKCGALSPAAYAAMRTLAGMGGFALARSDERYRDRLLLEAQLMNQQFRMLQARRMAPVLESMGSTTGMSAALEPMKVSSALDPRLVKIAEELGCRLAHEEMDKEALNIGQVAGFGKKTIGGLVKGLGRTAQSAGTGLAAAAPTSQLAQSVGRRVTQAGTNVAKAGGGMAQRGATQLAEAGAPAAAAIRPPTPTATVGLKPPPGVTTPPPPLPGLDPSAAPVPGPRPAAAATRVAPPPGVQGYTAPVPAPAAPAVGAAAAPATVPAAAKRPLIGTGTKLGLGVAAGGAVLGGGYLAGQGLTAARDYMMTPSAVGQTWGGYGYVPQHAVNQYGQVTPQF